MHDVRVRDQDTRARRRRGLRILLAGPAVFALVLLLAACGGSSATPTPTATQAAPSPTPTAPAASTPSGQTPTATASFQQQWQDLIAAAQKEGEVDIVAGGVASRTYGPVADAFGKEFGVKVNFSTGSSSAQASRILAERQKGTYTVDIAKTGSSTSANDYIPAGALDPVANWLIAPDVLNQSDWFQGHWWWGDTQQKYNFIFSANVQNPPINIEINTNQVNPADITSVYDFLASKYVGKLGALPPTTGGAQQEYFDAYADPDLGPDFVQKYVQDMKVFYNSDYRQIENQLADGTLYAAIFAGAVNQDVQTMQSQGLPVELLQKQVKERGMLVSAGSASNIGIFNHPAHPNAAKLFINWWLSKTGQTAMQEDSAVAPYVSLREDGIPPGKTLPETRRQSGQQYLYIDADPKYLAQKKSAIDQTIAWYNAATGQ